MKIVDSVKLDVDTKRAGKWLEANQRFFAELESVRLKNPDVDVLVEYVEESIHGHTYVVAKVSGTDAAVIAQVDELVRRYYVGA